jgi:hypothetical protein
MRGQPHVDSSSHVMLPRPKVLSTTTPGGSRSPPLHQHNLSPHIPTEHDAELLRLVAADTTSHRRAWAPNSKAWQTFIRRQGLKGDLDRSRIPEEGEETEDSEMDLDLETRRSPVVIGNQLAVNGSTCLFTLWYNPLLIMQKIIMSAFLNQSILLCAINNPNP